MGISRANISQRQLEGYLKWAEIVQWGRRNPTKFAETILGVQFMDYQKYVFMNSWDKQFVLWLMGRGSGKSTLSAPFAMTKLLLFPNFESYILSLTAGQSQDTFLKMENIAKKQIESFTGLTDVFLGELEKSSNHDGFVHSPQGFRYRLYNGSKIISLSGEENNIRGKRSNLNIYDESGFISENYIATTKAFATQDSSFKLGGGIDTETVPKNIPNQLLFCSSASSTDTYFYGIYKEWAKLMYAGSTDHFVADINCEVVINATCDGVKLFTPLLSQSKVDDELRQNAEKGRREFYNVFDADGGSKQPIKRSEIIKNSVVRKPVLANTSNESRRFGFFYDPARSYDNSCVVVVEYVYDEQVGWKMIIQNVVTLVDIGTKKKIPMRTPEQIEYIKQMIIDYNGKGFADYENIDIIGIDSGAGGAGVNIADYFMEDWIDKQGNLHRGLIDKEESKEYVSKFPNAVNKLKLISPKKYRTEMFDDFIELLNLGLIEFTDTYDLKGYIMLPIEGKEDIEEYDEETKQKTKVKSVEYKKTNLSWDEELALKTIDLAKEELVLTTRFETSPTQYKYDLPADKKSTHHDDRAYALCMASWHLKNLRRKSVTDKKTPDMDWSQAPIFVQGITL